ncbi:MAG: hypothetical protein WCS03_15605 [Bacteroidota bacterium]
MKALQLLKAFKNSGKRVHMVGDTEAGVIIALDMEGRLFVVLEGNVLNRTNLDAIKGENTRDQYLNPGGDGLWPAPEGTSMGYQYSTGTWRVPPGLRSARYIVSEVMNDGVSILAEVDLVNNQGLGVPTIFRRQVQIETGQKEIIMKVHESITYIGCIPLPRKECLLAPWSLCQFDSGEGCDVVFPCTDKASVWDLYNEESDSVREWSEHHCRTLTDGTKRYQIAIGEKVPWIEFHNPKNGLKVRRTAGPLPQWQSYIDIRDVTPNVEPSKNGVRYSVYSDTSNFMEIEAVGGCPVTIMPNEEIKVQVATRYSVK